MKTTCDKCGVIKEIQENEYPPGSCVSVPCAMCGNELLFHIPHYNEQSNEDTYLSLLRDEMVDGTIVARRRPALDILQRLWKIDNQKVIELKKSLHAQWIDTYLEYSAAIMDCAVDGCVSGQLTKVLERLRVAYGIDLVEAKKIEKRILKKTLNRISPKQGSMAELERGEFSVDKNSKVEFSTGNLQYSPKRRRWRFAPKQWECIGDGNKNICESFSGWIDLFGWGTSGWDSGAIAYLPWTTDKDDNNYQPGGNSKNAMTGKTENADWGKYNDIGEDSKKKGWRTPSMLEWDYLLNKRKASEYAGVKNARYAKAKIADANGLVVFPDVFNPTSNDIILNNINEDKCSYASNSLTEEEWIVFEKAGCIFLPSAGYRNGNNVSRVNAFGYYWSSRNCLSDAYCLYFSGSSLNARSSEKRHVGRAVRLIRIIPNSDHLAQSHAKK